MPTFSIQQRESWDTIVTYNIDADTKDQAEELTRTGTCNYDEHEVINRDCKKLLDIHETRIN